MNGKTRKRMTKAARIMAIVLIAAIVLTYTASFLMYLW